VALTNTQLAACAGALAWAFSQYVITESPHILGFCSGVICGLTSITSGAAYVSLWSALFIGAVGGILAYVYSHLKTSHYKENKDSLDVFGCHGIGGAWGGIAVGLFATVDTGSKYSGLFYGEANVFGQNLLGVCVIGFYSFFVIWINIFILERLLEMKVPG
jgi:Amt family ammonium transporter